MAAPPRDDGPVVEVPQGRVRGQWLGTGPSALAVYRGLPYAAAPFGARRFLPPEPAPAWQGVRDATVFGPVAPQAPRQFEGNDELSGGPDCLTLNIWTPAQPGERLPVMVWIPGGGFIRGGSSDPLYDGANLARQGMVFVSINYRLGADGFMHFPDATDNRGLLDQLAALQWVQRHIAAFGGDPARVTVAGVSAGAGSVACLLGTPRAAGLFRRAILQSPSVSCQTPGEAQTAAQAIAQLLGVPPTRTGIAAVPLPTLVRAIARLASDHALRSRHGMSARNFFPLRPVVDGALLIAPPLQAMATHWARAAPPDILVGANAQEMRFYLVPGGEIDRVEMPRVQTFVQAVGLPDDAVQAYRARMPGASAGELLCAMQSDYYYRVPAQRIARLARGRAFLYEFGWKSPQYGGRLGAAHAIELPFVFGNLATPQGLEFTGPEPPQHLSAAMTRAWASFVTQANAGWPRYESTRPVRMQFDEQSLCIPDTARAETAVWTPVL